MTDNQREIFTVIEENIRKLAKEKGINLNELITEIEMTEGGFYKMIQSESMKIRTLKKIADVLEQPIQLFFEGATTIQKVKGKYNSQIANSTLSEPKAEYYAKNIQSLEKQVQQLESQLADKDKIIELLSKK